MSSNTRRIAAGFLLLAVLAQAGGGLMAAVCAPGMDVHPVADVNDPADGGGQPNLRASSVQQAGDPAPNPCPFGSDAMPMCGGALSVVSINVTPPTPIEVKSSITPAAGRIPSNPLPFQLFRPPRD